MSSDLINTIATIVGVIVAIFGAFLFAFWVSMGIWTFNDIRSRSRDWLAILLACLLVLVFPIVGLILYLLIRPKETLAEVYDRALEEEALLRELESTTACHQCGSPIKEAWVYCPTCHAQLQHSCSSCGNLARAEWDICVMCGTAQQPGVDMDYTSANGATEAEAVGEAARRGGNPFYRPLRTIE
jgi:RNA polymerase subunit RPABC4/transcription elongation factor Spt4